MFSILLLIIITIFAYSFFFFVCNAPIIRVNNLFPKQAQPTHLNCWNTMHHWLALLFSSHYFHKIYITVNQFPATCEPIVRVECRKNAFIKIFIALPSTALHAGPHVETSLCRDRGGGCHISPTANDPLPQFVATVSHSQTHAHHRIIHQPKSTSSRYNDGDAFLPYLQHQKLINHFELCRQHCLTKTLCSSRTQWWGGAIQAEMGGIKFHFPRIKRDNAKKSTPET